MRAVSLAMLILPFGLNRKTAKTKADSTLPSNPARLPKARAVTNRAELNIKGVHASQERPLARALTPRAASAHKNPPIKEIATGDTRGHDSEARLSVFPKCRIKSSPAVSYSRSGGRSLI